MVDVRDAVRAGEKAGLKPSLLLAGGSLSRRKQSLNRPCYSGLLPARSRLQIEINSLVRTVVVARGVRRLSDTHAVVVFFGIP